MRKFSHEYYRLIRDAAFKQIITYSHYDQDSGRFMSLDPIGFEGGDVNLYRYVGNNPVKFIDPFGLHVYLGSTASILGLHMKVAVDSPDSKGQYGVSFAKYGNQSNVGIVYKDSDPFTALYNVFYTTQEEDKMIYDYLRSQVNVLGYYNVATYNCRDYSRDQFAAIVNMVLVSRESKK